ncbi:MAG: hypothetical protein ABSG31_12690 [Tepidisphaeraceae bacterium]
MLILTVDVFIIWLLATHRPFPNFVLLWPALFSTITLWLALGIINDRRKVISIEAGGIMDGRKFVPWSSIFRFAAFNQGRFTLFYTTKPFPRGIHMLISTDKISRREYEKLVDDIKREIQNQYPNLKIGGYEDMPKGGAP